MCSLPLPLNDNSPSWPRPPQHLLLILHLSFTLHVLLLIPQWISGVSLDNGFSLSFLRTDVRVPVCVLRADMYGCVRVGEASSKKGVAVITEERGVYVFKLRL